MDRQSLSGLILRALEAPIIATLEARPVWFRHKEKCARSELSAVAYSVPKCVDIVYIWFQRPLQRPERGVLRLAGNELTRVDEALLPGRRTRISLMLLFFGLSSERF